MCRLSARKGENLKRKVIIIVTALAFIFAISFFLNREKPEEQMADEMSVQVELSAINSDKYFNSFKIKAALEKYAQENQIECQNATALDYSYEDLESAEQIYDIYFLLDDKKKTLVTICYHPQLDGVGLDVKAKECEYTLDEIKSQVWYKEDYQ